VSGIRVGVTGPLPSRRAPWSGRPLPLQCASFVPLMLRMLFVCWTIRYQQEIRVRPSLRFTLLSGSRGHSSQSGGALLSQSGEVPDATRPPGAVSRAASSLPMWMRPSLRPSRPRRRLRGWWTRTHGRGVRRTRGLHRRAGRHGSWPEHCSGRSGLPQTAAQGRSWASWSASRRSLRFVGHADATTHVRASFPVQPAANTR
jgi:hypothetical protein